LSKISLCLSRQFIEALVLQLELSCASQPHSYRYAANAPSKPTMLSVFIDFEKNTNTSTIQQFVEHVTNRVTPLRSLVKDQPDFKWYKFLLPIEKLGLFKAALIEFLKENALNEEERILLLEKVDRAFDSFQNNLAETASEAQVLEESSTGFRP